MITRSCYIHVYEMNVQGGQINKTFPGELNWFVYTCTIIYYKCLAPNLDFIYKILFIWNIYTNIQETEEIYDSTISAGHVQLSHFAAHFQLSNIF